MPFGILTSCVYYTVENVVYTVVEPHGSWPLWAREIGSSPYKHTPSFIGNQDFMMALLQMCLSLLPYQRQRRVRREVACDAKCRKDAWRGARRAIGGSAKL